MRKLWPFILAVFLVSGCKKKSCQDEQDISEIQLSVNIESLENELIQLADTAQLSTFLEANPVVSREFFNELDYPSHSVMLQEVYKLIKNPYTDTLYQQVKATFGNGENLKVQFEDAFKRIKFYYPEFEAPRIQTIVSGLLGSDVYLTDSLIIIGLDFHLGKDTKYKPDLFQYLLDRMTPEHLVPSIVKVMSSRFNESDLSQRTMLDEMIFYGKAYQFTRKVMPCIADSLIAEYTHQQMLDTEVSESYIWSYFVQNELIYDKRAINLSKFVNERPSVPEIAATCPGRIGRWVGWRMIQEFEKKEGDNLVELMAMPNAREILTRSKYRPRSR